MRNVVGLLIKTVLSHQHSNNLYKVCYVHIKGLHCSSAKHFALSIVSTKSFATLFYKAVRCKVSLNKEINLYLLLSDEVLFMRHPHDVIVV